MPILKLLRLTKHYGANTAGEIASFTPETAAHIQKNGGGELIGDFDPARQVVVERDEKVLIVDAEPELDAGGKPTGNLVEKKTAKADKKPDDKKPDDKK
ncbi:MAG: hypothetical protein Q8K32_31390 [Archangium sp.]|nr:hypothetical protein [Archangium sp.]